MQAVGHHSFLEKKMLWLHSWLEMSAAVLIFWVRPCRSIVGIQPLIEPVCVLRLQASLQSQFYSNYYIHLAFDT